jgi:hypothetical protein
MSKERLPSTNVVDILKNNRNAENSIKAVFYGRMELKELTPKEVEIYDRVIHLKALIKDMQAETGGRYKSSELVENHMSIHGISLATAKRDLSIVSELEKALREAVLELERGQLYEAAWRAIDLAEKNGETASMASNIRVAKDLLGIDKEAGNSLIAPDKIEQHINIIIADHRTTRIMEEMVRNNMSVNKWSMSLEDILAEEAEPQDIEHEVIESREGEDTPEESD